VQNGFLSHLAKQVDTLRERWSISEGKAFMMWYACEALELDEDVAYEAVSYDGSNDKDIDLFYLDEEHERIVIGQGKYHYKGQYKAKKNELLGIIHSTDWLENLETVRREGRPQLTSAAEDYVEGIARGYSVEYQYVFAGPPNANVNSQADLYNAKHLDDHPIRHATIVDIDVLRSIHADSAGEARIPSEAVTLVPGRYFTQEGSYGRALVATLPAAELSRLYGIYGDRLFARNVRLFLGTRAGGVNAGIRSTLESPNERMNFWAYNNGVTLVCDSFELDRQSNSLTLANFSIVNGCQTTVLLGKGGAAAASVDVLARFIASPVKLIDNVIFYTNSQTPLRGWELRAQDKRQKKLQKEMAGEPNPYYYALRRGEARTLRKKERARYVREGQFQAIRFDLLAQYLASFRGLPYVAYKDKGKLFSGHYDDVFPRDLSVEEALLAWRAGEAADREVKDALLRAIQHKNEFETLVLKRGGKLFTVAVMSQILSLRNGPNYLGKLKREVVTSKRTLERLTTYAKVAVVWYVRATRQMAGPDGLERVPSILRTQESYPRLSKEIEESWTVQAIDKEWVSSLPKL